MNMPFNYRVLIYISAFVVVVVANSGFIMPLLAYSYENEYASHIILIPIVSVILLFFSRKTIAANINKGAGGNTAVSATAIILLIIFSYGASLIQNAQMDYIKITIIIVILISLFVITFGIACFKKVVFPFILLFFMMPVPESAIKEIIASLQKGSAEGVSFLLMITGTPFHREGMRFILPKFAIEIASECSGIRSSMALVLTCILIGQILLKRTSHKILLVLAAIPMAMLKNAIRIVTLSMLAIHFDMNYLSGELHRRGGIVFFGTTLLVMIPILWLLMRSEQKHSAENE
jgi:exosortase